MRAKHAHALTLARFPPHCFLQRADAHSRCVRACVHTHARRCLRSERVEELQRLLVTGVSPFTERGSYFMVFPATSCCFFFFFLHAERTVIPYVLAGNVAVWVVKSIKNKHNMNMVSKTSSCIHASFHERVAPLNECEMWRDFYIRLGAFCRLFFSFFGGSVHPFCQNPVKSG